ncbi:class 1 fructose-bisphosphatase [Zavarzinia compransoris]|uniref:Fructose-1,6-bisphosphatase class 1 n=1 Tax=Zavarzinia compransoris TaxID=1264899 RepID=A0A317E7T6_9PROT|nr:class 1 fructose-bisphosphatase [Zavarzinia compransoris]PWR23127.1 class 1 fructose-bisphosphatase [Zavarzinia compransoris]TDP46318.1 D-fructose 1,6-bisphosphatase [Zavarzinia compransoris]
MRAILTDHQILLEHYLDDYAGKDNQQAAAVAATVLALAGAGRQLAALVALGPLAGAMAALRCGERFGDSQKELDLRSHDLVVEHLAAAPVAIVGSEEADEALVLDAAAPLAVAVDPLDGSSNIETNAPIGTIFSIYPVGEALDRALLQPGSAQLAAGLIIYGPQTLLVLTVGRGTSVFVLDPRSGDFALATAAAAVPARTREYAINASNQRHWDGAIKRYIGDCQKGAEGPRGLDFNTRWVASMVADAYRILVRGGIYLYPGDDRAGYREGRLRLVYEANPIAFLMEQAGGAATDGRGRILDIAPRTLHQRVPLVFGSADEVAHVARYHSDAFAGGDDSPLFGDRSLFRA